MSIRFMLVFSLFLMCRASYAQRKVEDEVLNELGKIGLKSGWAVHSCDESLSGRASLEIIFHRSPNDQNDSVSMLEFGGYLFSYIYGAILKNYPKYDRVRLLIRQDGNSSPKEALIYIIGGQFYYCHDDGKLRQFYLTSRQEK